MTGKDERKGDDPYLWLEEVEGGRALDWVRTQSAQCDGVLEADPRFAPIFEDARKILTAPDRIPYVMHENGRVHNFWQDDVHVRGILRCATYDSYLTPDPDWETVLDVDQLAREEDEDWVYSWRAWLEPECDRCLVFLSRGGSDATVMREFDMRTRAFVEGGFFLPEGKQRAAWLDRDRLLVTTAHGGGGLNTSGYPRTARIWHRGTAIDEAALVYEAPREDALLAAHVSVRPDGRHAFIVRAPDFFTRQLFVVEEGGSAMALDLPRAIELEGVLGGHLIVTLRADWEAGGTIHAGGSVVSVPLEPLVAGDTSGAATLAGPPDNGAIEWISVARNAVLVGRTEHVEARLDRVSLEAGSWHSEPVQVPEKGALHVVASDPFADLVLLNFESFLVPPTLYRLTGTALEPVKSLPARFDAAPFTVEQNFATSADGTRVPYFRLHRRDAAKDGSTPTVVYGYGGFESSATPAYASPMVKNWLEAGGAWVVANIRGGGEYGPRWHQAALKENRQRAFDDFIAVAEDLIARRYTSSRRLGIYGGSNGGLLVGAVMVQRPELFRAVACAVPLLDMLRFHKLLAGASWIGEYGDPEIASDRAFIERYSPYQNVRPEAAYPKVFFFTSTRDDRVHPGHARKMAAKMMEQGHDVIYYENPGGGHSSAADLIERAKRSAQVTVFCLRTLADD